MKQDNAGRNVKDVETEQNDYQVRSMEKQVDII